MKILWLARTIPLPETAGDRIYTYQTVRALARASVNVDFIGLQPDVEAQVALDVRHCAGLAV